MVFAYAAFTLYGPTFQRGSTNHQIGDSTVAGPTTPTAPKTQPSQILLFFKIAPRNAVNRFDHIRALRLT